MLKMVIAWAINDVLSKFKSYSLAVYGPLAGQLPKPLVAVMAQAATTGVTAFAVSREHDICCRVCSLLWA